MPSYLHTGQWVNVFHHAGEIVEAAPGEVVKFATEIVHDLLHLVDDAKPSKKPDPPAPAADPAAAGDEENAS